MLLRDGTKRGASLRQILTLFFVVAVCVIDCRSAANAQEDLPTYDSLVCETNCPVFKEATKLVTPKPSFPLKFIGHGKPGGEAVVQVRFTVAKDGSVKNLVVEKLIGAPEFQDSVLETVKDWTFHPATENGTPVEENFRKEFFFADLLWAMRNHEADARLDEAAKLIDGKNQDQAEPLLHEVLAMPDLSLYERSTASFLLANAYVSQQKDENALSLIRDATIGRGRFLLQKEAAFRLRLRLEAESGNIAESLAWFDVLKKVAAIPDDDPDAKLVASLRAMITSPRPIEFSAVISSRAAGQSGEDGVWQHALLKRSFGFANITGQLKEFDLICRSHGIKSPVSDAARWTVPVNWTACVIFVRGSPATKFNFLEADAESSTH